MTNPLIFNFMNNSQTDAQVQLQTSKGALRSWFGG